jgi:hypothetical protein
MVENTINDLAPRNEAALLKQCLLERARQLQVQGRVPDWLSETEMAKRAEAYLDEMLRNIHTWPFYLELRRSGRLEMTIRQLLEQYS